MQYIFDPFLWIGMTVDILRILGKVPVEKDRLNSFENIIDKSLLRSWRIEVGILLGPEALILLSFDIRREFSALSVGDTKIECGFEFLRYFLKSV